MESYAKVLEFPILQKTIVRYCSFSLGRIKIEELEPSYNELIVQRELLRTKQTMEVVYKFGSIPFSGCKDIRIPLEQSLKDAICLPNDLLDIARHAQSCHQVKNFILETELEVTELIDLVNSLSYSLELSSEIERCINAYGEVKEEASKELKNFYRQYREIEGSIQHTANRFIQENAEHLMDTILTMRNDRLVVLVKIGDKNKVKGIVHGESSSGQTAYIEPEAIVQLNNRLQSIQSQIQEEIERILWELSQQVKSVAEQYLANLETLAILDALNAKACWGKETDAVIATINHNQEIYFKDARHPLIDPKKVVSNSYQIEQPYRMLLLTGPNTGGKTVSLKIIGLFTWMTLCGLPVCCEEATIPMIDAIYVDMGDEQSIVQSLSTFSAHLYKLASICNQATAKSLVLLDEIGGGTDPKEGESLAIGVLEYLRKIKSLVVVTTHYSGLKTYGKSKSDILLASVSFDLEKMQPTYQYREGISGESFAFAIAEKLGLKPEIIATAKENRESMKTTEEHLLEELEAEKYLLLKEKEELAQQQKELNEKETVLETEKEKWNEEYNSLQQEARREVSEYVKNVQDEADLLFQQLKEQSNLKLHEAIEIKHRIDQQDIQLEEELPQNHVFEVGDIVRIKDTTQQGRIEAIDRKKASIVMGSVKLSAPLKQVDFIRKETKKSITKGKSTVRVDRPKTVPFEVNLIGLRVEEALPILNKYLDDCVLGHLSSARIIHGHGTGALRKAVAQVLDKNPHVESYTLAQQSEGGSGATIVSFKKSV